MSFFIETLNIAFYFTNSKTRIKISLIIITKKIYLRKQNKPNIITVKSLNVVDLHLSSFKWLANRSEPRVFIF